MQDVLTSRRAAVRAALLAAAAALAVALAPIAGDAGAAATPPLIPKKAKYLGKTSAGKVARVFVSRNGTRIGYTIFATLRCENGAVVDGMYWTTEGRYAAEFWIRPKRDGSFALNSSNMFELQDGWGNASASFAGRFRTPKLVTGTFSSRVDYFDASGALFTRCASGPLTWTARRTA